MNYTTAFNELQLIKEEVENGDISIDDLSEKIKRANYLVSFCKQMLYNTQTEITQLFDDSIENEDK